LPGHDSTARYRGLALAVFLLALALRLYRADAQSLWYDEGTSAALAGRPLPDIARAAANDIHPPLYYLLLALWVRLFGDGVVALRALSACLGSLLVAGVIRLGGRLWGRPVGIAAGLLAAISPYLVWYSQEVRMYMLGAALGVGLIGATVAVVDHSARRTPSPDASLRSTRSPRSERSRRRLWGLWALWTLLALAALHTQYFVGASVVAAADAVVLLAVVGAWRAAGGIPWRLIKPWTVAHAALAALFAPWLAVAWPALSDWPALGPPVSASFVLREGIATYALGMRAPPGALGWWPALALLGLGGLAARGRDGTRRAGAIGLIYLLIPLGLMVLLSYIRPAWNPKFLIGGAPGFELLAGAGVAALALTARWAWSSARASTTWTMAGGTTVARAKATRPAVGAAAAGVVLAALVIVSAWPRLLALRAMYFDPAYQRDDYRGLVAVIDGAAGPADAVILNAPTQVEVFGYYDRGRHATYPLPLQRPADRAGTLARLTAIGERHGDLYAVLWATGESDPDGIVEEWLNANRYKAYDRWFGGVRLVPWALAREPMADRLLGRPAEFGESEILLIGLRASPLDVPLDAARGGVVTLEAVWAAGAPPRADYTTFLHLIDADGRLAAQRDLRPLGGTASTSRWAPLGGGGLGSARDAASVQELPAGTPGHVDRMALVLPRDLAPGDYQLRLGLYDPAGGARLPVRRRPGEASGGAAPLPSDAFVVGTVRVRPARPGE